MKDDNLYQKVKSAKKEARKAGAKYYKMEWQWKENWRQLQELLKKNISRF